MRLFPLVTVVFCAVLVGGCRKQDEKSSAQKPRQRVVLYCSVDDVYVRPIIKELEAKTGLKIDTLYDTEAAKTAGLANRIRAERNRPQGDVFWSSALLQTLLLQREGLLAPYVSPSARDIPPAFKDLHGSWTAMGVRSRVIVFHSGLKSPPRKWEDLLQPALKNRVGISNPQFGTASDWVSALTIRQGQAQTLSYFRALKQNGVRVLPGNSVVAERVARGELLAGVTDGDDYLAQKKKTGNIETLNTQLMAIPGSVALLKGAPHLEAAHRLIDELLKIETEMRLAQEMPGVYLTRKPVGDSKLQAYDFSRVPNDAQSWPKAWISVRDPLAEILLRD